MTASSDGVAPDVPTEQDGARASGATPERRKRCRCRISGGFQCEAKAAPGERVCWYCKRECREETSRG